jgi:hypothetical protein
MKTIPERSVKVVSFSSFDEENQYEYERRRNMTVREKLQEFEVLQKRRWGSDWTTKPMVKKVTIEKLSDRVD